MKKIICGLLGIAVAALTTSFVASPVVQIGGAHPSFFVHGEFEVVKIENFTQSMLEDFILGNLTDVVIECQRGTEIPFNVTIDGDFLVLRPRDNCGYDLTVVNTCFIKCPKKKEFYFSGDLQNWKKFKDFFSGALGISLNDGGPQLSLDIELNRKE